MAIKFLDVLVFSTITVTYYNIEELLGYSSHTQSLSISPDNIINTQTKNITGTTIKCIFYIRKVLESANVE